MMACPERFGLRFLALLPSRKRSVARKARHGQFAKSDLLSDLPHRVLLKVGLDEAANSRSNLSGVRQSYRLELSQLENFPKSPQARKK